MSKIKEHIKNPNHNQGENTSQNQAADTGQAEPTNEKATETVNGKEAEMASKAACEKTQAEQDQKGDEKEERDKEIESLNKKIEQLESKLLQQKDLFLRLAAEYDNFRKRTQREKEFIFEDAKMLVLSALLPGLDNFDRIISVENSSFEDYKKGVEMTIKQVFEALSGLGLTEIKALNCTFDPELHEAVAHVQDESKGENMVVEVFQKGYKVGDRVLRHAKVKVAN